MIHLAQLSPVMASSDSSGGTSSRPALEKVIVLKIICPYNCVERWNKTAAQCLLGSYPYPIAEFASGVVD